MITVIMPAFNEEDSIGQSVRQIRDVSRAAGLPEIDILVVDDGSSDRTCQRALEAGALVVRHPHNLGYGRALKAGIRRSRYDTIVIVDADLTYPFACLPVLLNKYNEGYDMVVGARSGEYFRESLVKGNLRGVLKWLVEFTAGRKIPDINSGLRVFSKKTIFQHLDHLCDTFSFTTSLTLAYMMTGKFVSYVAIDYKQRSGRTKVRLLRDSLRTLQYIVQAITFYNPLKIFVLLSWGCLASALFCLLLGAWGSFVFLSAGASFLVLAGLMFAFGLIADLIRQIGMQLATEAVQRKFSAESITASLDPKASSIEDIEARTVQQYTTISG